MVGPLHKFILLIAAAGASVPGPLVAGCLCSDPAVIHCPQCRSQSACQSQPACQAKQQCKAKQHGRANVEPSSCCSPGPTSCCSSANSRNGFSPVCGIEPCVSQHGSCECVQAGPLPATSSNESLPQLVETDSAFIAGDVPNTNLRLVRVLHRAEVNSDLPPPHRSMLSVWIL